MAENTPIRKPASSGIKTEEQVGLEERSSRVHNNNNSGGNTADDSFVYMPRPKSKPEETLKGKLNRYASGYCEFVPARTGESKRQTIRQLGDSSFYKTEGRKESSYSCHLNVDGASADPVGEMDELYLTLTRDQRKQPLRLPEGAEGRVLLDTGQVTVRLDRAAHQVQILTTLDCSPQIERMLLKAQADMSRTIGRYRDEIINNVSKG